MEAWPTYIYICKHITNIYIYVCVDHNDSNMVDRRYYVVNEWHWNSQHNILEEQLRIKTNDKAAG